MTPLIVAMDIVDAATKRIVQWIVETAMVVLWIAVQSTCVKPIAAMAVACCVPMPPRVAITAVRGVRWIVTPWEPVMRSLDQAPWQPATILAAAISSVPAAVK